MGDEQHGSPDPAATANRTSSEAPRRDQDPLRPAASAASSETQVRGDHVGQAEAAQQATREGAGIDLGAPPTEAADTGEAKPNDLPDGSSEAEEVTTRIIPLDEIEGHVVRQIRYHEARVRFLDFWRRAFDFLVVVLGAGAVSAAAGEGTLAGTIIGISLAAIGALQLVAGFSEKAGEHASLKRRFCGVLAEITEARGEPDGGARRLPKITKKWTAIWADEPPTMHVLEAIAHNAARRSLEYKLDEATLIDIGRWHSWTRNLSSWERFEPLNRAERTALREAKRQARARR